MTLCQSVEDRKRGRIFQEIAYSLAWMEPNMWNGSCEMRLERQKPDGDGKQLKDFECGRD